MNARKLFSLLLVLTLLTILTGATSGPPLTAACVPGASYNAACDVDHDGDVDIFDIQLTAGHWGQAGTYNIYPAMLPKTGQTTSHAAGDDGALQKGVAWPDPRFTDNSNGTVTDNLTAIIWLKNANCFGSPNWVTALNNANALNSGECGLTDGSVEGDWRLPNVRELHSLVDYGHTNLALPSGNPFISAQTAPYWTSTTYADNTSNAWYVSLSVGDLGQMGKSTGWYAWPVRGGQ